MSKSTFILKYICKQIFKNVLKNRFCITVSENVKILHKQNYNLLVFLWALGGRKCYICILLLLCLHYFQSRVPLYLIPIYYYFIIWYHFFIFNDINFYLIPYACSLISSYIWTTEFQTSIWY